MKQEVWKLCSKCCCAFESQNHTCPNCGTAYKNQEVLMPVEEEMQRKRRRKTSSKMPIFAWSLLGLVTCLFAGLFIKQYFEKNLGNRIEKNESLVQDQSNSKFIPLNGSEVGQVFPILLEQLNRYFQSPVASSRAGFVYLGKNHIIEMDRYYSVHPIEMDLTITEIQNIAKGGMHYIVSKPSKKDSTYLVLQIPTDYSPKAMHNNKGYEYIFRKEEGSWKVDWFNQVRYGSEDWNNFLNSKVEKTGEFRLYAEDATLTHGSDKDLAIWLSSPVQNQSAWQKEGRSLPVIIPRSSPEAEKLFEAWREQRTRKFGSPGYFDPKDTCRITAKVTIRPKSKVDYEMVLEEIKSMDWMDRSDERTQDLSLPSS